MPMPACLGAVQEGAAYLRVTSAVLYCVNMCTFRTERRPDHADGEMRTIWVKYRVCVPRGEQAGLRYA